MAIIAMATGSNSESSSPLVSSASSGENPLVLSYESSLFGSEVLKEYSHSYLYEPLTTSGSDDEESNKISPQDSVI